MLLPLSVISRIPQDPATGNYLPGIQKIVDECPKIVISALNLAWVIYLGPKDAMGVVTTEVLHARNSDGAANPTGTKPGLTHALETIFEEEHHNENFGCKPTTASRHPRVSRSQDRQQKLRPKVLHGAPKTQETANPREGGKIKTAARKKF